MRGAVVLAFALLSVRSAAQTASTPLALWQHTSWTGENGPPLASGTQMQQSPDGYLWLSAPDALIRFDGVRFKRIDATNTPEFKSNVSAQFLPTLVDRTGIMWVSGPKGLLLSYRDGKFRVEMPSGSDQRGYLVEDGLGRLWTQARKIRIFQNGKLEAPPLPKGVSDSAVFGMQRDNETGMWIGTNAGLWHVSGDSAKLFGGGRLRVGLHSKDGTLWTIGAQESERPGLWRLSGNVWREIRAPHDSARLYGHHLVAGPDGATWFATNRSGLIRVKNGVVEQFSTAQGLTSLEVRSMTVSADGTVWAITPIGLDRLRAAPFTSLGTREGVPYEHINAFAVDGTGALWTSNGESTVVHRFQGGSVLGQPGMMKTSKKEVSDRKSILVVAASHGDGVWVRETSEGLYRVRENEVREVGRANGMPAEQVTFTAEARDGTIWFRLFSGQFGRVREGRYRKIALPGGTANSSFVEDGRGRMWVAVNGRPVVVALQGDSIIREMVIPSPDPNPIVDLILEHGDTLWGGGNQSLFRITSERIEPVSIPGLQEILAAGVSIAISHGQLYIASTAGIARVSLADLHSAADKKASVTSFQIFSALDGIPIPYASSTIQDAQTGPDGRVWIATPVGLAVSSGDVGPVNFAVPQVHIEEASLGEKPVVLTDGSVLEPNPQRLAIHFSAPSLGLPERVRLEFRLEGSDETWIDSKPPHVALYNQLRPGHYRFRVRAWNENGVPSAREATLQFRVRAAWYQSWWFFVLCIAAVAGVSARIAIIGHRRRSLRNEIAAKARFDAVLSERTRLARELHDTLLQGFTGITLHLDGVRDSLKELSPPLAADMGKLLQRADRTLRDAREMVWDMRQPALENVKLREALGDAIGSIPNQGSVIVEHTVDGVERSLSPTVASTILRIAREAVVNAIKHSGARKIDVHLAYDPRSILLEISDDGCGAEVNAIEAATSRGHWGVAGMRERVRSVGGTFAVTTSPGAGMHVRVSIPAD